MLKFLFYLALFYYLFRLLFNNIGRVSSSNPPHTNQPNDDRFSAPPPPKTHKKEDKIGEYVDFEEIKE